MINLHYFHASCEMFHGFSAFSITKNNIVLPALSKFTLKLIFVLHWDQHQALVTYLKQRQLIYNFLWNKNNLTYNQLCNDFFDLLHFFECDHVFLNRLLLVDQKKFLSILALLFLISTVERNNPMSLVRQVLFSKDKSKGLFTAWKIG